jgi:hypothetical protein
MCNAPLTRFSLGRRVLARPYRASLPGMILRGPFNRSDLTSSTMDTGCASEGWFTRLPVHILCRGTSLIRHHVLLGPYSRAMPRALRLGRRFVARPHRAPVAGTLNPHLGQLRQSRQEFGTH